MANKLKIYACSGLGTVGNTDKQTQPKGYNYWTDNTDSVANTQAVNTLLSLINLNNSEVQNLRLNKTQQLDRLDSIDFYVVCLDAAQQYAGNAEQLFKAGQAIGAMCDEGLFKLDSLKNTERDAHLDKLLDTFEQYLADGKTGGNEAFTKWWNTNVQERNKVGLTTSEQEAVKEALAKGVSGIGETLDWQDNEELAQYLNKASEYFLYLYFTDEQLKKLPRHFRKKKEYQQQVYNYCKGLFIKQFGSEAEMQNIIRAGIVGYFKAQPEDVCASIAEQKYKGIGELSALMTGFIIVIATLTALVTIVKLICDAVVKSKTARYESLNQQIIDAAAPDTDDFADLEDVSTGSKNKWITIGIIAAGLLILLKK